MSRSTISETSRKLVTTFRQVRRCVIVMLIIQAICNNICYLETTSRPIACLGKAETRCRLSLIRPTGYEAHSLQALTTLGDFVQSFFFSAVFFCLVEAPTTHIEKMIFLKISKVAGRRGSAADSPPKEQPLQPSTVTKVLPIENYRL